MHPDLPPGRWLLLTLTLGIGGSLPAIGSAPGIGLPGRIKGLYLCTPHALDAYNFAGLFRQHYRVFLDKCQVFLSGWVRGARG